METIQPHPGFLSQMHLILSLLTGLQQLLEQEMDQHN